MDDGLFVLALTLGAMGVMFLYFAYCEWRNQR